MQEEADTNMETAEEVEIFIFELHVAKENRNGFPITETYQPRLRYN